MQRVREEQIESRSITNSGDGCHYFYGYYDNPAFSADGQWHLCHKVGFWDRLPTAEDAADIGMVSLTDGSYRRIAETTAWNFQQGSMLQWNPKAPNDEIIYNVRAAGNSYKAVVQHAFTGEILREISRPVANVSRCGNYALSISFERMFDFRPGYGYAGHPDPWRNEPHPEHDGIFLINMSTGESKLILSLASIAVQLGGQFEPGSKLLINHITFNTDGSRFIALVRNFRNSESELWKTIAITANADGSGLYVLSDYGMSSHYHWRDEESIVMWNGGPAGSQLYVIRDRSQQYDALDPSFFPEDGHCSYSYADTEWLLYDSYADRNSYRHLYLYHTGRKRGLKIGSYYSEPVSAGDIRTDLHPRWSPDGSVITFDSTHEGRRSIYAANVSEVKRLILK